MNSLHFSISTLENILLGEMSSAPVVIKLPLYHICDNHQRWRDQENPVNFVTVLARIQYNDYYDINVLYRRRASTYVVYSFVVVASVTEDTKFADIFEGKRCH